MYYHPHPVPFSILACKQLTLVKKCISAAMRFHIPPRLSTTVSSMAVFSNVDVDKSSWLKWQIAVAIGAPVVIGFGYWYFVRNKKRVDSKKSASSTSNKCKAVPDLSAEQNGTNKIGKNSVEKTKTPPVSTSITKVK